MDRKPNSNAGARRTGDFREPLAGQDQGAGKGKPADKKNTSVSASAIRLFDAMQMPDFAQRVAQFMSMSPEEMGEAARIAAADSKISR